MLCDFNREQTGMTPVLFLSTKTKTKDQTKTISKRLKDLNLRLMDVKCKTGMKLCNIIKAKHIDFALTE